MSNRLYRMLFGLLLLIGLYFGLNALVYGLVAIAVLEGITNLRLPIIVSRLRGIEASGTAEASLGIAFHTRSSFEAERGFRLLVASMLAIGLFVFPEHLWFFPWFIGFALLGAGASGVCPMYLALRWCGLR
ncbi:hypothetical protein MNBD_GAMMA15-911 [hydrothermal vent metagenome]|uniref:Inner membrane protein YgaP-like transmembrane domain-containing protein n=1 Tax=hydrothermal vent metagenome TaxID=652676 RepID=A0A3B0Y4K0_9ZZZZ